MPSHTVHIRPPNGLQLADWRETFAHWELLVSFVRRDLTLRYRQTLLGVAWVVLQPLLSAGVLTVVFSKVAKLPADGHSYLLVALTGSICWTTFAGVLSRTASCLVGSSHLISKIYFPRLILPLSAAAGALVDAVAGVALLVVSAVATGETPGWLWTWVPVWVFLCALMALGPGLALAAAMVRYRDVAYVLPIVVQLGLYITPVGYLASAVPASSRLLVTLNPLSAPIGTLRHAVLGTSPASADSWTVTAVWFVIGILAGLMIFRRAEARLADVI